MDNFSQKTPSFKSGQALPAGALNHIVEAVKRLLVAGAGIRIERAGDQIVIHAKGQPMARGGGGGGPQVDYVEASKELLEAHTGVVDYARGRVNAGVNKGVAYIRNVDNDGWVALNRLE